MAPTSKTSVVVAAASRHGGTAEIASRIAQTLGEHVPVEWSVTTTDLVDLHDLDGADAVVLGSAVYMGRWLHPAIRALQWFEISPGPRLWLFSTGPVTPTEEESPNATVEDVVQAGRAREHRTFGGRLELARLSRWERLLVRVLGAASSDRRDWTEIDAWSKSIAEDLVNGGSARP